MTENKTITLYKIIIEDIVEIDKDFLINQIDLKINKLEEESKDNYQKIVEKTLNQMQTENNKKWFGKRTISFEEAEEAMNKDDNYFKLFIDSELDKSKNPYVELKKKIENNSRLSINDINELELEIERDVTEQILLENPNVIIEKDSEIKDNTIILSDNCDNEQKKENE